MALIRNCGTHITQGVTWQSVISDQCLSVWAAVISGYTVTFPACNWSVVTDTVLSLVYSDKRPIASDSVVTGPLSLVGNLLALIHWLCLLCLSRYPSTLPKHRLLIITIRFYFMWMWILTTSLLWTPHICIFWCIVIKKKTTQLLYLVLKILMLLLKIQVD